ncbi:hypothetical protein Sfulv_17650 [Streptomyces fulvorobeus]|uniref:Uncharacterized protein n=1 Tax=Streptomyces fulvorobeus TaxID=284028 RepID=A0A7J0C4T0_9ACTN|nr:hypothetical protein Sfulv_17650 [Streptomyces fulvorobeus]
MGAGVSQQCGGTHPGPGERLGRFRSRDGRASVVQPHLGSLVDVLGGGLGDEEPARGEQVRRPPQQQGRVAADADVAVEEQDSAPAALPGKRFEDRPAQGGTTESPGTVDRGIADVDTERAVTAGRERGHQPPGSAPDVQDGSLTTA